MKLIKIEIDPDKALRYLNKGEENERKFCHVILYYKGWFGREKTIKATPIRYYEKIFDSNWGVWKAERIDCFNELGEEIDYKTSEKILNFIKTQNL
jgi:hypothetical protein